MRFQNEPYQPQNRLRRASDRGAVDRLAILRVAVMSPPALQAGPVVQRLSRRRCIINRYRFLLVRCRRIMTRL